VNFFIANTFTDSLARLTVDEQNAVKTTAVDLQLDPANPGMRFHKLDKAKDKNFWSMRVGSDIRLIVHRTAGSLILCYVDRLDQACAWVARGKLATHPLTSAAQFVEIREHVEEIAARSGRWWRGPRRAHAARQDRTPAQGSPGLVATLERDDVLAHPFVVGELTCGNPVEASRDAQVVAPACAGATTCGC